MSRKRFSAQEIVNKLREADVLISQGQAIAQVFKHISMTRQIIELAFPQAAYPFISLGSLLLNVRPEYLGPCACRMTLPGHLIVVSNNYGKRDQQIDEVREGTSR